MKAAGKRYIQYASRSDKFRLWNIADIHKGSRGCAIKRLKHNVEEIREDPFSLWVGVGDYADYITPTDRRFDPETLSETFKVKDLGQVGKVLVGSVARDLAPIKDKCIGLGFGNHEYYYMLNNDQQDLHGWLCTELGVENLGYCGFTDLVFIRTSGLKHPIITRECPSGGANRRTIRVFTHHGSTGSRTPGGKINSLEQAMLRFDADITILAHVHSAITDKIAKIRANAACTRIMETVRVGLIAGTFLRTYTQDATLYGEIKMYAPSPLGATYTTITPMTGELRATV